MDWICDRKIAYKNIIKSYDYNKKLFDKNRKDMEFNVGDMVYVENGNKLNRRKLDELRIGPSFINVVSRSVS
ncbi:Integrase catalytic domain-containing protein [Aphis craccivora]|uniref:Integrase catalytic domain-containing protein n=1 Tax=Aphis craccivora TaxID=307492 RepID=A0A6G0YNH6_APHCR|nr:Integrase catalytic domain-containing protein [Aphis craccivora]